MCNSYKFINIDSDENKKTRPQYKCVIMGAAKTLCFYIVYTTCSYSKLVRGKH